MKNIRPAQIAQIAKVGVLLGLAGGAAEIVWIAFYGSLAGSDAAEVARGVSTAVAWLLPAIPLSVAPVISGIVVHMILAVGVGIVLAVAWRELTARRPVPVNEYVFMVGALTTIWAFNFFIALPLISPTFVDLVPYPVSLMSKVLFGLAGATALRYGAGSPTALIPIRTSDSHQMNSDPS